MDISIIALWSITLSIAFQLGILFEYKKSTRFAKELIELLGEQNEFITKMGKIISKASIEALNCTEREPKE